MSKVDVGTRVHLDMVFYVVDDLCLGSAQFAITKDEGVQAVIRSVHRDRLIWR